MLRDQAEGHRVPPELSQIGVGWLIRADWRVVENVWGIRLVPVAECYWLNFQRTCPTTAWAAQPGPRKFLRLVAKSNYIVFCSPSSSKIDSVNVAPCSKPTLLRWARADEELDGSGVAALSEGAVGDDQ
jgi:hypothetical protein